MITNGIITGATNPANEGLTVREVITREVAASYRLINSLANKYTRALNGSPSIVDQFEAARLTMDTDETARLYVLDSTCVILAEIAAQLRNTTFAASMADCGMLPDYSNVEDIITPVYGVEGADAVANAIAIVTLLNSLSGRVNQAAFIGIGQMFGGLKADIDATANVLQPVSGVAS